MRTSGRRITLGPGIATILAMALLAAPSADAGISTKLALKSQFGLQVNLTEVENKGGPARENVCTVLSGDMCQRGKEGSGAGAFGDPTVAAPSAGGNVYVADTNHRRIEVFTAEGAFVSMFGWDVNATKVADAKATQAEKNLCTAASGDVCQAGEGGEAAGQIEGVYSLAVDQSTGNVYVLEVGTLGGPSIVDTRVEEYTAGGEFILMMGGEVDQTKDEQAGAAEAERNVCTAASGDVCKAGVPSGTGSTAHGAFDPSANRGNLLGVGGPKDLLYVGDQGRVQELEANGKWVGEISLRSFSSSGSVSALAVDASGDLDVVYRVNEATTVHEYDPSGTATGEFKTGNVLLALARDPFGDLAVIEAGSPPRGVLYSAGGIQLREFGPPEGIGFADGLGFTASDDLYVADSTHQDVETYAPVPVATPVTGQCRNRTATSLTLTGEVNPEGLSAEETRAWFQYGTSAALGSLTPVKEIGTGSLFVPIEATLQNLSPNQTYHYRVAAEDQNDHAPEPPLLAQSTLSCATLALPPAVEGEPSAFEATFSSAVLFATLNPENAKTSYRFQYGACEAGLDVCASRLESPPLESSEYGQIGAMQTVSALAPNTAYRYRLVAVNEHAESTVGQEGSFMTAQAPSPSATTAAAQDVTASSALLSGVVNPDGAEATYSFQVGIDNGADTAYGTVVSGATGAQADPIAESFALGGLQPGTSYAYRIVISSAYGTSIGQPARFTTAGLPGVLFAPSVLAQLPVPSVAFPSSIQQPKVKAKKAAPKKKAKKIKRKTKKARKSSVHSGRRHGKGAHGNRR